MGMARNAKEWLTRAENAREWPRISGNGPDCPNSFFLLKFHSFPFCFYYWIRYNTMAHEIFSQRTSRQKILDEMSY